MRKGQRWEGRGGTEEGGGGGRSRVIWMVDVDTTVSFALLSKINTT